MEVWVWRYGYGGMEAYELRGYRPMPINCEPGIAGMWHKGARTTILASPSPACLETCCTIRKEKESSCHNEQENGLVVPVRATRTVARRTGAYATAPAYPHSHT